VAKSLDEFGLIQRYFDRTLTDDSVLVGIGDDGAVLAPDSGRDLITVIDTLVEGVHFPASLPPDAIGYRSVAVNLSDIAAMGARPRWMTLALTLDEANEKWLEGFAAGLFDASKEHDVSLVGGDTTRGDQKVISVQLTGDIDSGMSIKRTGAVDGDLIFVSGTIGDAAAGLSFIKSDDVSSDEKLILATRFCRPSARVALGQELKGLATAAIDISDGLFSDIHKLIDKAQVGATIETESIPISPSLRSAVSADEALHYALTGGDDYELCFTISPGDEQTAMMRAEQCDVPITRIGVITAGNSLSCTRAGKRFEFDHGGYRHF
jgi:thiamine-monophosphate kinase